MAYEKINSTNQIQRIFFFCERVRELMDYKDALKACALVLSQKAEKWSLEACDVINYEVCS